MSTAPSCAEAGHFIYLASASPRRQALLQLLGLEFEAMPQALDESRREGEPPLQYVERLARAKADAAGEQLIAAGKSMFPILGADTAVVCGADVLGKPADPAQAVAMLLALSGRWHRVLTAVAVRYQDSSEVVCSDTRVLFRTITDREARAYVAGGEPLDKAGAYGIQGLGSRLVEQIQGSYSGVVGLPLVETEALLARVGVTCRW